MNGNSSERLGRVTGLGRLFRRRRGSGGGLFLALYRGGSAPLALGHFVSRLGRGLVRGRLTSLGLAATAGPRPSRFTGPRFFFLGLAAPPALGLFRLGRFFPGGLALFGGPLFLGGLFLRGRGGRLFRFGRLVLFHLRTFRRPALRHQLFNLVSGDIHLAGSTSGGILGGRIPSGLLGGVLRGRGLRRGSVLGRSTLRAVIEQAGLGIFFLACVQFFVCHSLPPFLIS